MFSSSIFLLLNKTLVKQLALLCILPSLSHLNCKLQDIVIMSIYFIFLSRQSREHHLHYYQRFNYMDFLWQLELMMTTSETLLSKQIKLRKRIRKGLRELLNNEKSNRRDLYGLFVSFFLFGSSHLIAFLVALFALSRKANQISSLQKQCA